MTESTAQALVCTLLILITALLYLVIKVWTSHPAPRVIKPVNDNLYRLNQLRFKKHTFRLCNNHSIDMTIGQMAVLVDKATCDICKKTLDKKAEPPYSA